MCLCSDRIFWDVCVVNFLNHFNIAHINIETLNILFSSINLIFPIFSMRDWVPLFVAGGSEALREVG